LVAQIIQEFRKIVPATEIGSRFNVSAATAMRYFNCFNQRVKELPEVLSLDEFKGNSGGQKYNSIVVDPKDRKILDIVPNRYENDLIKYFSQFPSKTKVKYFVCDMNPHFRNVANTCFRQATVVADRYHVVRQVFWAMEKVRKNEQSKLPDRHRKYFKKSRFLLMKPIEKLTEEEMARLALMFEIAPRLADAYRIKNEFLTVFHSKSSAEGRPRLADWLLSVEVMQMPEYSDCVTAYRNWFQEILNSMDVPWSNGYIEGCNNKTKVLKRVCFGMRNFNNFRKRILFCNT
jgi:transposase